MARTQTLVQLTDDLVKRLDDAAARRGVSRSALIRDLVDDGLRRSERDIIGEQIAEGYRRIPPGTPDGWADLERLHEQATKRTLERLAAEERAAGYDPW